MCGIIGLWGGAPPSSSVIEAALGRMAHRGPDGRGQRRFDDGFLAMCRLAIIDVAGGQQPLESEDGNVVCVVNGEIYDHVELRARLEAGGHRFSTGSDAEVLVHLWEDEGADCFSRVTGMFAAAIVDRSAGVLCLARDRFGQKPLYLREGADGSLAFASEIKALEALCEGRGDTFEVDETAIYDYLSLGFVPQPRTVFRGVRVLEPARTLTIQAGGQARERSFWTLPDRARTPATTRPRLLEELRRVVDEAVRIRLRSDVPLGIFLSGGLDSSVVALAATRGGGRPRCFTVSMGDEEFDEAPVARRTAAALGLECTVLPLELTPLDELESLVELYDQPYADASAIPSRAISRLAREHVTVVLNGDGGDEIFGGYRRHLAARVADALDFLPAAPWGAIARVLGGSMRRRTALGFAARLARGLSRSGGARYLVFTSDLLSEEDKVVAWRGASCRSTESWIEERLAEAGGGAFGTQIYGDARIILQSDFLVKMDMASMSASLEARSPLLDHHLAELVFGLNGTVLCSGMQGKALLREAYRGLLPAEVLAGAKKGFEIPLDSWLRGELRPLLMDTVGSSNARCGDLIDKDFLRACLDGERFADRNGPMLRYALLMLELWLRGRASRRSR